MIKQFVVVLFLIFSFQANLVAQELANGIYAKIFTSKGEILAKLYYQRVPKTTRNFIGLAEGSKTWTHPRNGKIMNNKPLYSHLLFHRVIPNFMIQTGDPLGNGTGGPGYRFADEFHPDLKHDKPGRLSMANAGPNTNGSQFFITHVPTPWLNYKHSVFGQVIRGQKVVDSIQKGDRLEKIKILRIGEAAKKFSVY